MEKTLKILFDKKPRKPESRKLLLTNPRTPALLLILLISSTLPFSLLTSLLPVKMCLNYSGRDYSEMACVSDGDTITPASREQPEIQYKWSYSPGPDTFLIDGISDITAIPYSLNASNLCFSRPLPASPVLLTKAGSAPHILMAFSSGVRQNLSGAFTLFRIVDIEGNLLFELQTEGILAGPFLSLEPWQRGFAACLATSTDTGNLVVVEERVTSYMLKYNIPLPGIPVTGPCGFTGEDNANYFVAGFLNTTLAQNSRSGLFKVRMDGLLRQSLSVEGFIYRGIVAGDLDQDSRIELAFPVLPAGVAVVKADFANDTFLKYNTSSIVTSRLSYGDLTGDHGFELVFARADGKVECVSMVKNVEPSQTALQPAYGRTLVKRWEYATGGPVFAQPLLQKRPFSDRATVTIASSDHCFTLVGPEGVLREFGSLESSITSHPSFCLYNPTPSSQYLVSDTSSCFRLLQSDMDGDQALGSFETIASYIPEKGSIWLFEKMTFLSSLAHLRNATSIIGPRYRGSPAGSPYVEQPLNEYPLGRIMFLEYLYDDILPAEASSYYAATVSWAVGSLILDASTPLIFDIGTGTGFNTPADTSTSRIILVQGFNITAFSILRSCAGSCESIKLYSVQQGHDIS
ncbi:MAG: hypothetical protein QW728_00850, partial [Thermoplasmata archaeon]